jgi:hypothetical protein
MFYDERPNVHRHYQESLPEAVSIPRTARGFWQWLIPAAISLFNGINQNNAANQQLSLEEQQMQQQQVFRNLQQQLGQGAVNTYNQTQPMYNQMSGWANNLASGGDQGALPSWMQTDWKRPFTDEELSAMTTIQDLTTQQQGGAAFNQAQGSLQKRGLSAPGVTSTADIASNAGLQNWITAKQAQNKYDVSMAGITRGDTLRNEQAGNYYQILTALANRMNSLTPMTSPNYTGASIYQQNAQNAGQAANQSWNAFGQALQQGLTGNTATTPTYNPAGIPRENSGLSPDWYLNPPSGYYYDSSNNSWRPNP